jgi:hypothetical protein
MPDIPEKYQDRVLVKDPNLLLPKIQAPELTKDIVIAIRVAGFEIAALYNDRTKPYAFAQLLLERFKAAGAPVEGVIKFKLLYGKIFKLKSRPGDASFRYCWLPPEHCQALGVQGEEGILVH